MYVTITEKAPTTTFTFKTLSTIKQAQLSY